MGAISVENIMFRVYRLTLIQKFRVNFTFLVPENSILNTAESQFPHTHIHTHRPITKPQTTYDNIETSNSITS